MTLPREVLPGRFYMITRRCSQRMFLLRPDAETNNAFLYCLAEAAKRYEIEVLMACAMSNHHHTVIFDRFGRYPEFIEHFHKLVARSQNALRGRWENFWAPGQASVEYKSSDVGGLKESRSLVVEQYSRNHGRLRPRASNHVAY
jgi:putative transposase